MKNKMEDLLLKLDGLKQKKEEIVKQRDGVKEEAEAIKKKTGLDLLSGVDIDKAGAELLKNSSRIETLNSAINALVTSIQEVELDLQKEKAIKAKKDTEALGKEADDLFTNIIDALGKMAQDGKSLADIQQRAYSLDAGHPGTILKHRYAGRVIYEGALNVLNALYNVDESVKVLIRNVK